MYRPGANTELGGFGLPDSFGVTEIDNGIRIVWHYEAANERRTFTISYRFKGLAVAYDDVVDVNLRVWGEHWPEGLGSLTSAMLLPGTAKLSPSYRVWGSPAWVRGVVARFPETATLRAAQVPPHQFVEFRVLFPRSLLTSTAGAQVRPGNALDRIVAEELASQEAFADDQEKIEDAKRHPVRTISLLLLLGFGPALGLMGLVWLTHGRERRTGYDREYEQAPPTDTEPALVPSLVRQETAPGSNEFTATLFDLIRRGRYKATPVTHRASGLGRAAARGRGRSADHAGRRGGGDDSIRGAGRKGRGLGRRHRGRAAVAVSRGDRARPRRRTASCSRASRRGSPRRSRPAGGS